MGNANDEDFDFEADIITYGLSVAATIRDEGAALLTVPSDEDFPGHAYTVGFTARSHRELIMFAPVPVSGAAEGEGPSPFVTDALCTLVDQIVDHGARFGPGDTIANLLVDRPVRMVEVIDPAVLTFAVAFYATSNPDALSVDALQVIYPDDAGRWPWEPGSQVAHLPVLGIVAEPAEGRLINLG